MRMLGEDKGGADRWWEAIEGIERTEEKRKLVDNRENLAFEK